MPKPVNYPEKIRIRAERGTTARLSHHARASSYRRPDGEPDLSAAARDLLRRGLELAERERRGRAEG